MIKEIKIISQSKDLVRFDDLVIIQEDFKDLFQEDFLKAKRSLIKHGIARAFKIAQIEGKAMMKLMVLDGTQMVRVLKQLKEEMWLIPEYVPVEFIEVRDIEHAHELILEYAGVWGRVTIEGVQSQTERAALDFDQIIKDIRLPDFKLEIEEKKTKTKKLKACPHCGLES